MNTVPAIVPVSDLRNKHVEIFSLLKDKRQIVLAQRSKPAAVLVSIEEWDALANRLGELEWRERAREAVKEARESTEPDISFDTFMTELRAHHAGA